MNNATIESHEMESLNKLVRDGNVVELLRPSLTKHVKTGDFIMECVIWEMKCPIGKKSENDGAYFSKGGTSSRKFSNRPLSSASAGNAGNKKLAKAF